jgi:hypothetical protein
MLEPGATGGAVGPVGFMSWFTPVGAWEATWADAVDNAAKSTAAVQIRYFMIPRSRYFCFSKKGRENFSLPFAVTAI